MLISKASDIKVGQTIWCGFDDRPLDGFGYCKGIVTAILDDHYLYTDTECNIENVWGLFDDEPCSVANFTTEDEVKEWLGLTE